jgi:NitT/TauT family transport system permease protein
MKRIILLFLYPLPLVLLIAGWHLVVADDPRLQFIFSSPTKVAHALFEGIISGRLLLDALVTASEALAGFVLGTSFGALLGLSLWYSKTIATVARPYIVALGAIPIIALAPVTIVWFGIGMTSKIMMAALSTVAIAIVQAYQGATSVDSRYLRLMQVMGASRFQIFRKVVVPSALVWVVNSMKLNIGMALLGAFIGEFISAERGLGYVIVKSSGLFDMANVFAAIIMLTLVALFLAQGVSWVERRWFWWRNGS